MKNKLKTNASVVVSYPSLSALSIPEPEWGSSGEEDGLGFGLGLLEEPEEGVILYTDFPEDLTAIPAGHGKLQRVVVGILLEDAEADIRMGGGKKINKTDARWIREREKWSKEKQNRRMRKKAKHKGKERRQEALNGLTVGSALSLIRNRLRLKLSLRTLDQLKALIFVYPWIKEETLWDSD